MGWISKRHMQRGGSIGGGPQRKGPLRKIVHRFTVSHNIFESERVELECGHTTKSWGGIRARCPQCLDDAAREGGGE